MTTAAEQRGHGTQQGHEMEPPFPSGTCVRKRGWDSPRERSLGLAAERACWVPLRNALTLTCAAWGTDTRSWKSLLAQGCNFAGIAEMRWDSSHNWCATMGSFPSTQHWWGHAWSDGPSAGLPSTRETWPYWRESNKGPPTCWRDWSIISYKENKICKAKSIFSCIAVSETAGV